MSDTSQGHGWWQATDGKWYPPESHPDYRPSAPSQSASVLPPAAQSYAQHTNPVVVVPTQPKKPLWKRWWFIALAVAIALIVIAAVASPKEDETPAESTHSTAAESIATEAPVASASADATPDTVPASPVATEPQASTAPAVVSQPAPESNLSPSQQNALRSAENYLSFMSFSRQGLIDQLSSEFGDQFPVDDATVAVDSLNVDWNEQAVGSAQNYLEMSGFSCQGLIDHSPPNSATSTPSNKRRTG